MPTGYYWKNKGKLRKEARERYQNLSKEEKARNENMVASDIRVFPIKKKEKKRQYERERYKYLSEYQKQRIAKYKKNLLYNT